MHVCYGRPGLLQRLHQHGNGALLHAGRASEAAAPVTHGQIRREEAHDSAGILGVEHVGAGRGGQQAAHELGVVGVGKVTDGAATGQGLQDEGAVGFAFGGRKLRGAAKRASGPG